MIPVQPIPPNHPRLIVNADDYGHTAEVSTGIREVHLRGIVTSTTAMMNMPGLEEALEKCLQECPRMGLGVHLILTTGFPLLPSAQVHSLLTADGTFPGEVGMIERLSRINLGEVEAEWRAQIERFIAVSGRSPDHLDSHHHISYLWPGLFRIQLELAQRYGCAIRLPTGQEAVDVLGELPTDMVHASLEGNLRLVEEYRPRHPDHFIKSFYGEDATRPALLGLLAGLLNGTTEIMCHPGYAGEDLIHSSGYHKQRETELAILTGSEIMAYVQANGIELIDFGDL